MENGKWKTRFSTQLSKRTYGGDDYQTIMSIHTSAKQRLSGMKYLRLRYRYENIGSDNVIYNYLDGWRQQLRAEYIACSKSNGKRLYYELELNDRQDTANASYSPTRHTVRGVYAKKLDSKIRWGGDIAYRRSAYNYPVTATQNRDDTRWRLAAQIDCRYSKAL
jgi:hypothetical protein